MEQEKAAVAEQPAQGEGRGHHRGEREAAKAYLQRIRPGPCDRSRLERPWSFYIPKEGVLRARRARGRKAVDKGRS